MKHVFLTLPLLAAVLSSSLPARAASDVPLRHMVFAISVGIRTVATAPGSGIGTSGGSKSSGGGIQGSGTITADVLAPTQDGGLIINISEEAQNRKAPVVRVAVRASGEVLTPASAGESVTEEEKMLLRYLARALVDVASPAKGVTWDYNSDAGGVKVHTTFRVMDARPDGKIDLDVAEDMSLTGGSVTGTTHGRVTYDTKKVIPDRVDISSLVRQEGVAGLTTTTITFVADLREDTFAGAK